MHQKNIRKISKSGACTGCGLCVHNCPRTCITLKPDEWGSMYPEIDNSQCIDCHICENCCPENSPLDLKKPLKAYVAVRNQEHAGDRLFPSSSGGIASLIYQQTLNEGGICAGTLWNREFEVELHCTESTQTLEYFKNSKYVYSKLEHLLKELADYDLTSRKTAIVALPCQIAALKKKFGDDEHILYVDLVCHGVMNAVYFQEYLESLNVKKENIDNIIFRVPGGGYKLLLYSNWEGG